MRDGASRGHTLKSFFALSMFGSLHVVSICFVACVSSPFEVCQCDACPALVRVCIAFHLQIVRSVSGSKTWVCILMISVASSQVVCAAPLHFLSLQL